MKHLIVPIIALYKKTDNTILLSIRKEGKQLAGYYEFPGGKTEDGETPSDALCREIYEELDITIQRRDLYPIIFTDFKFEEKIYTLLMYYCDQYEGKPHGKEGQIIEWAPTKNLENYNMPFANAKLIPALQTYIRLRHSK